MVSSAPAGTAHFSEHGRQQAGLPAPPSTDSYPASLAGIHLRRNPTIQCGPHPDTYLYV